MKMEWLPVRCCCTPSKLFGFLRVKVGAKTVRDHKGVPRRIKIKDYAECVVERSVIEFMKQPPEETVISSHRERAVYSDDRPIEFWRSVDGFVEVP